MNVSRLVECRCFREEDRSEAGTPLRSSVSGIPPRLRDHRDGERGGHPVRGKIVISARQCPPQRPFSDRSRRIAPSCPGWMMYDRTRPRSRRIFFLEERRMPSGVFAISENVSGPVSWNTASTTVWGRRHRRSASDRRGTRYGSRPSRTSRKVGAQVGARTKRAG